MHPGISWSGLKNRQNHWEADYSGRLSRQTRSDTGRWGSWSRPIHWEADCSECLIRRMLLDIAWWGLENCPIHWENVPACRRLSPRPWGWNCRHVRRSARRRARGHAQQSSRQRAPLWRRLPSIRSAASAEQRVGPSNWIRAVGRRPRVAQAMALGADRLGWQAGAVPPMSALLDRNQHWLGRCWQVACVSVPHRGCTCLALPSLGFSLRIGDLARPRRK